MECAETKAGATDCPCGAVKDRTQEGMEVMRHLKCVSKELSKAETSISADVKVEFISEVLVAFGDILAVKEAAEDDTNTTE